MSKTFLSFVFLVVLVADQVTKYLAYTSLSLGEAREVIPNFFNLTLVYNPGAAFGLFSGLPDAYRWPALAAVSVVAVFIVLRFMLREANGDPWSQTALMSILGGALGNIIDRFRFDGVVDFLDFYYGSYHWPAFNIADSAICLSVTLLIVRMLFCKEANGKVAPAKSAS